jgi:hypothetical protein
VSGSDNCELATVYGADLIGICLYYANEWISIVDDVGYLAAAVHTCTLSGVAAAVRICLLLIDCMSLCDS